MRTIKELKTFAKRNKNRDVHAESVFRKRLEREGIHYQRQKVINNYIVDFYLPKRNLIIEIDGLYHIQKRGYDQCRQTQLESFGWIVVRFTDKHVLGYPNHCIETVRKFEESSGLYRESKRRLKELNGCRR